MKKFILLIIIFFFILSVQAETLVAGVAVEEVPKPLFGTWRVLGSMESSNSYESFRGKCMDFWELSRKDGVITLYNPQSFAKDEVSVDLVEGNLVIFTRTIHFDDNKVLTDKVHIRLNGNKFEGLNDLKLEQFSLIDGHLMSTKTARYLISGEKISGESVIYEDIEEAPVEDID